MEESYTCIQCNKIKPFFSYPVAKKKNGGTYRYKNCRECLKKRILEKKVNNIIRIDFHYCEINIDGIKYKTNDFTTDDIPFIIKNGYEFILI